MGEWTREELEGAFADYQAAAAAAATSGDWQVWADKFTDDADYVEHAFGNMKGKEAIRSWISKTMSEYPASAMISFPIEWYVIDEDRGWVVCQVWNRMADPGDGSTHQAYNFTLLKYAGNGLWSYEEDIYNPAHFVSMLEAWQKRKDELQSS